MIEGIPKYKKPDVDILDIPDTRKVDSITGNQVSDRNNLSRKADLNLIKAIIDSAKKMNIDPYTALAIAHQETGLYDQDEGNPFHIVGGTSDPSDLMSSVNESLKILKEKFDYANKLGKKDEASIIQAWNGYGKVGVGTEGYGKRIYGLDVSAQPIDMNKNPVYGKRILDIRDNILKRNPDIVKLVGGDSQSQQEKNLMPSVFNEPLIQQPQQSDASKKKAEDYFTGGTPIYGLGGSMIGVFKQGKFMPDTENYAHRSKVNQIDTDLLNNPEALRSYLERKGLKM